MVIEEEDKQTNFEKPDQSTQVIRHKGSLAEKGSNWKVPSRDD